ncbi:alpha-glycosidase [Calorimonas adulescens]|uniref:Alpha-glycosidase n=1 Tax=Calorimonas adulescens TaxID=2606906 RepID=A0A5D8QCK6_9THEO|nr:alpha-glycosidase [Calorimonas adulescens]TZE82380.1 alpha-glycosidase [Calorimonas adulescens]
MNREAIYHRTMLPFAYPVGEHELRLVLRAAKDDIYFSEVFYGDRYAEPGSEVSTLMRKEASDSLFDYYTVTLYTEEKRVRYFFHLSDRREDIWYSEKGFSVARPKEGLFQYPYICPADLFSEPEWIRGRTMYQIFPDRFCNGDRDNDPEGCLKWGETPKADSFFGGDLKGIIDRLDYLADLGIGVIYLTPIFKSPSNHKYDTADYYSIDPAFGDRDILKRLVSEAHRRDIKVILDGVFNHCGKDFFAFQDVVKHGASSPYKDWFNIHSFPVRAGKDPNYETFASGVYTMPKLMTHNPELREYLIKVGEHWVREVDIDGWRLDVANEIDHDFWREFRKRVKAIKPDAFIIGEVWHDSLEWLRGDQFDSVMNYPWREAVLDFFARGEIDAVGFDERVAGLRMAHSSNIWPGLVNLLGSHDTARVLTLCSDRRRAALAAVFQMTYPGLPMIYYGDEIGMEGGDDPDCRRTFIWDEEGQDNKLLNLYRQLIKLRRIFPHLSDGDYRTWHTEGNVYAYINDGIGVVINNSDEDISLRLDNFTIHRTVDILSRKSYGLGRYLSIDLKPYSAAILLTERDYEKMREAGAC